jgi:hypothetical protein
MSILNIIKLSLILGSVITLIHQWPALYEQVPVDWLVLLLSYGVSFVSFYGMARYAQPSPPKKMGGNTLHQLNPGHLEALYKQASLVERNAHKANAVFNHQLQYIKKLLAKTRNLQHGDDYDAAHASLVKELGVLEHHVERIVTEMNKNVKLGEKLQQSIANIDPDIGVV